MCAGCYHVTCVATITCVHGNEQDMRDTWLMALPDLYNSYSGLLGASVLLHRSVLITKTSARFRSGLFVYLIATYDCQLLFSANFVRAALSHGIKLPNIIVC